MGFHTFDVERADMLEEPDRFRHCSAEELVAALGVHADATVADLGSGTGFFTDVVAPHVGRCYAVDVQPEMHDLYREKGVPETVEFLTAEVADLPLDDDALDAAFSTMTYHEYAGEESVAELARVVRPGGRVVTVDWTAAGSGEAGPPRDERFALGDAVSAFESAGFTAERAETRVETFLLVARR
ncbi:methyltransferase domain-containing protein [Halorarum halophilum]|uniref:Methyltransferase domain-containing protein n=1 Tax=Halorarum halophilum TaxID=2743090 RepID=A0A7D5KWU6_9EURY|nr:methyltransferase domain-containing protein [Halobaculum halophilum]QLG27238.1 methyltransferase domain-containing protein [Halobaculum halophilum]